MNYIITVPVGSSIYVRHYILILYIIPLDLEATSNEREGGAVSEILVNHEAEDAHHGGSAIVELDGTLLELPCVRLLVPAKVEGAVAEVSLKLWLEVVVRAGRGTVGGLHEEEGEAHLSNNLTRKGIQCGKTGGDVLSAGESDTSICDKVSCCFLFCVVLCCFVLFCVVLYVRGKSICVSYVNYAFSVATNNASKLIDGAQNKGQGK